MDEAQLQQGMENGKEPGLGTDTFSRAEGKSRCMTGFREAVSRPGTLLGASIPGIFLEAVGTRASHLGHPNFGNSGSDHHLGMKLGSIKIASQVWGDWARIQSCENNKQNHPGSQCLSRLSGI